MTMENEEAINRVLASVCNVFDVDMAAVKSKSRVRKITDARKAIAYFLRKHVKTRSIDISRIINKDHSVINYLFDAAETIMSNNLEFKSKMDRIRSMIK